MRRLSLMVAGAAVGLVALTACGTTISGSARPAVTTPASLVAMLSSRTASVSTAHFHFTAGAAGVTLSGNGQLQLAGTATKMSMDMTAPAIGDMAMVLTGGTMYMKLPQELMGMAHTDKPWVRFDPNGTDMVSKELGALTSQEQQNLDPTQTLSAIAPFGTITASRPDTVDGAPATDYTIAVDTTKLLHSNRATPQVRQMLDASGMQLPPRLNFDIWINSANLPVRYAMREQVTTSTSGPVTVTMDFSYTDWGKPVSIQAPPADQVGTLSGN